MKREREEMKMRTRNEENHLRIITPLLNHPPQPRRALLQRLPEPLGVRPCLPRSLPLLLAPKLDDGEELPIVISERSSQR
jgi:hypothetical protein